MCTELGVTNRPGTLARIARVFSDRGINLGDILAAVGGDMLTMPDGETPVIVLTFHSSERMQQFLRRRLERMPEVAHVAVIEREGADNRPIWELLPELKSARQQVRGTVPPTGPCPESVL